MLNVDKRIEDDGQNDVYDEKREYNYYDDPEDRGEDRIRNIHQVVHREGPVVICDDLEDGQDGLSQVVESKETIVDNGVVQHVIEVCPT